MEWYLLVPILKAALAGVLVAATQDIQSFRAWKSYEEARAYNWRLAAWRWAQGAVLGVLANYGLGQVIV